MTNTRSDKSAAEDDIAAIEDLVADLEKRIGRLTQKHNGSAGQLATDALERIRSRVSEGVGNAADTARDTATGVSQSVANEVARIGSNALKNVSDEIEQRPLLMVAIAAGIGFLLGKRSEAR